MKTFLAVTAATFLLGVSLIWLSKDQQQAIDGATINEQVTARIGEEFAVVFNRDGNRLSDPLKSVETRHQRDTVKVKLALTSDAPFAPPREDAKRPYLSVANEFDMTLYFRGLVRMNGSKEYREITEGIEPVLAGETMNLCWGFDTIVDEVVLYDFKISNQPTE